MKTKKVKLNREEKKLISSLLGEKALLKAESLQSVRGGTTGGHAGTSILSPVEVSFMGSIIVN